MKGRDFVWGIVLAAGCIGAPARAADEGSLFAEVGNWSVFRNSDNCRALVSYGNQGSSTLLSVTYFNDGAITIGVTRDGWRVRVGQHFDVITILGDDRFSGAGADGIQILDQTGYSAVMGTGFLDSFARASAIEFELDNRSLSNLSLQDSNVAVATLRRCRTALVGTGGTPEK
jgi:hypothetical protein